MEKQVAKKKGVKEFFQKHTQMATFIAFVVIVILFSCLSENFLTGTNITNIINQSTTISLVAFGMTMVLLTGGIDLSVGGILALVCVTCAKLFTMGWNPVLIVLIGLVLGSAIGCLNGVLISRFKVQPFLITMGMVNITRGLAKYATDGKSIFISSDKFRDVVSQGALLKIPMLVYWTLLFMFITYFIVSYTPFGRRIQAVGGNAEAAAFSGIKVNQVKVLVYTISGFLAAIAGIVSLSRLSSGLPTVGQSIEMDAIASAVLGGTGFAGEGGNVLGTLLGSLVIGCIINGLTILGVDSYLQDVVKGFIIIGTVIISIQLAKKDNN